MILDTNAQEERQVQMLWELESVFALSVLIAPSDQLLELNVQMELNLQLPVLQLALPVQLESTAKGLTKKTALSEATVLQALKDQFSVL